MKMRYERPSMDVEQFMANEYIAACGDSTTIYKFQCNAGGGKHGDIFLDTNHNGILDAGDENLTEGSWRYFHACSTGHSAPTDDVFSKGFYVENGGNDKLTHRVGIWPINRIENYPVTNVIVWTDGGKDVHATQNLDVNSWETAKS